MAGFTPVPWVDDSLPDHDDVVNMKKDQQSMVNVVEELLNCGESFETKTSSYKKLRGYIRAGISPILRPNTWKILSGGNRVLETTPSLFEDIQDDLEYALFVEDTHFFNASYVNKYHLTDDGWRKVQEVLAVLAQLHCDVTFCPILQPLTCLFMHFMDKEDCFACMDSLFSSRRHSLDKSAVDYCITAKTFQDALKKWKVHILDNFLLDGSKMFYRIGLVLFDEIYKDLKNTGTTDINKFETIFREVAFTWSKQSSQLLDKAFKIPGVSKHTISELRENNKRLLSSGNLSLPEIELETIFRGPVEGSDLLSKSQIEDLFSVLPRRLRRLCKLTCIFSTEVHGTSLKTLYNKCQKEPCTVVLIKTVDHEILGAFVATSLSDRFENIKSFFGNGETFLFHFNPDFKRYTWCGLKSKDWNAPSFFILADEKRIVVGGGGGWGLSIEEDLSRGRSQRCSTFENEPLTSKPDGEFECLRVELWSLEELGHLAKASDSFQKDDERKVELVLDSE